MSVLLVTGTGTDVGKTVVTAALACTRAPGLAVVKPAQTGVQPDEPGDLAEVTRLSGCTDTHEFARYPDPLSPHTAARLAGRAALHLDDVVARLRALQASHEHVIVEGAGGLLVPFDDGGWTLRDLAFGVDASVVLVVTAELGTLNATALTVEALGPAPLVGLVIGSWPAAPELVHHCNALDLQLIAPLVGAVPAGASRRDDFRARARDWLAPALGGGFDPSSFRRRAQAELDDRASTGGAK